MRMDAELALLHKKMQEGFPNGIIGLPVSLEVGAVDIIQCIGKVNF